MRSFYRILKAAIESWPELTCISKGIITRCATWRRPCWLSQVHVRLKTKQISQSKCMTLRTILGKLCLLLIMVGAVTRVSASKRGICISSAAWLIAKGVARSNASTSHLVLISWPGPGKPWTSCKILRRDWLQDYSSWTRIGSPSSAALERRQRSKTTSSLTLIRMIMQSHARVKSLRWVSSASTGDHTIRRIGKSWSASMPTAACLNLSTASPSRSYQTSRRIQKLSKIVMTDYFNTN